MKPLEYLRRHRPEAMGFAALWIIAMHGHIRWPLRILGRIVKMGNMGVDLFIFLMGFGLAFSLEKRPSWGVYLKRRASRLLPSYYVALVLGMVILRSVPPLSELCAGFLPVSLWMGYRGYWFVCATLLYYVVAPPMWYGLRHARCPWLVLAVLMAISCLALPCATRGWAEIGLTRFPALVLGLLCGAVACADRGARGQWMTLGFLAVCFAAGSVLYRHPHALDHPLRVVNARQAAWIAMSLMAPLVAVALAAVCEGLSHTFLRFLNPVMGHLGRYSLELYLGHLIVRQALRDLMWSKQMILVGMLALSYPLARLIAWLAAWLLRMWSKLIGKCFPTEGETHTLSHTV